MAANYGKKSASAFAGGIVEYFKLESFLAFLRQIKIGYGK
jgi:hypothetical protein